MDIKRTIGTLLKDGLILVFNSDKLDVVRTGEALAEAGVNNMEVTCRISKPVEKIERLRREIPDFVIGTASLIDYPEVLDIYNKNHSDDPLPSVEEVVEAGVDYIVSAVNFSENCYEKYSGKVVMLPGCGTVSEILEQFSRGANFCKIFPAKQLGGPGFVKAIDPAIHKMISLIPMGGTNMDNIPGYIDAGVLVLGGSFSMIEKATMQKIIDEQDYEFLAKEFIRVKDLIDAVRAEKWPGINFDRASIEQISQTTGRNFNIA
jgi:2-dehydro-3-deoxyphosphogluconate aldolase/(4S)-4-hydroxy-2-oxoglutarate aldolase